MAELVKIDPKSLGIGQYQHDITPSLLKENLTQTVEWAVNRVGVNLNTAGYHLLSYVAGLDRKKAKEIVNYRSEKDKIMSIFELKKVKGIGEKAFEQCAGFLRIKDGDMVLDSTGVHPEAYDDIAKIAKLYNTGIEEITNKPELIEPKKVREQLQIKELDSIISELSQKGLDPREEFTATNYTAGIETIEDIKEGMIVTGVVDNVAAFGAFIDIGIKENGLVHVSEVSNEYIKDITSVLSVGSQITAKVIGIDKERKRISLSIKQAV